MIKKVTVEIECCICKEVHESLEVDPSKARTVVLGTLVASQLVKKGWKALSFVAACPKCKNQLHAWNKVSEESIQAIKKEKTLPVHEKEPVTVDE